MRVLLLIIAAPLLLAAGGSINAANTRSGPTNAPAQASGACKSSATFTSSAVPALQKDGCTGCHGGASPSATAMFDLGKVGKDNIAACASALKKVNTGNKAQSAILQYTTGAAAHPGGKVADTQAFTAAMMGWINNE